jgi:hypothetical protein
MEAICLVVESSPENGWKHLGKVGTNSDSESGKIDSQATDNHSHSTLRSRTPKKKRKKVQKISKAQQKAGYRVKTTL